MILTVLGREAEELGSQPIAMGLLGLGLVFASSAGLLAKMLPRAKEETLSD